MPVLDFFNSQRPLLPHTQPGRDREPSLGADDFDDLDNLMDMDTGDLDSPLHDLMNNLDGESDGDLPFGLDAGSTGHAFEDVEIGLPSDFPNPQTVEDFDAVRRAEARDRPFPSPVATRKRRNPEQPGVGGPPPTTATMAANHNAVFPPAAGMVRGIPPQAVQPNPALNAAAAALLMRQQMLKNLAQLQLQRQQQQLLQQQQIQRQQQQPQQHQQHQQPQQPRRPLQRPVQHLAKEQRMGPNTNNNVHLNFRQRMSPPATTQAPEAAGVTAGAVGAPTPKPAATAAPKPTNSNATTTIPNPNPNPTTTTAAANNSPALSAAEERRRKRAATLAKNREHAAASRNRKKNELAQLQAKVGKQAEVINMLKFQVAQLEKENMDLKRTLSGQKQLRPSSKKLKADSHIISVFNSGGDTTTTNTNTTTTTTNNNNNNRATFGGILTNRATASPVKLCGVVFALCIFTQPLQYVAELADASFFETGPAHFTHDGHVLESEPVFAASGSMFGLFYDGAKSVLVAITNSRMDASVATRMDEVAVGSDVAWQAWATHWVLEVIFAASMAAMAFLLFHIVRFWIADCRHDCKQPACPPHVAVVVGGGSSSGVVGKVASSKSKNASSSSSSSSGASLQGAASSTGLGKIITHTQASSSKKASGCGSIGGKLPPLAGKGGGCRCSASSRTCGAHGKKDGDCACMCESSEEEDAWRRRRRNSAMEQDQSAGTAALKRSVPFGV